MFRAADGCYGMGELAAFRQSAKGEMSITASCTSFLDCLNSSACSIQKLLLIRWDGDAEGQAVSVI